MEIPITAPERIEILDVLRGFAVLGILIMNINGMGLPSAAYLNPTVYGGASGVSLWLWLFTHVFVDGKMRTLFSLLFGAGVILLTGRVAPPVYFRRTVLLILFGLVHGNLLWYGDILYSYGVCGLLVYSLRNWSARRLMIAGGVVLSLNFCVYQGGSYEFSRMLGEVKRLEQAQQSSPLAAADKMNLERYRRAIGEFRPDPAQLETEIRERRGRLSAIRHNSGIARRFETSEFFQFFFDVLGMMIMGMALYKAGVLTGERPDSFYLRAAAIGFAIGIPILAWSGVTWMRQGFPFLGFFRYVGLTVDVGRFSMGLAYLSILVLIHRRRLLPGVTRLLAKAGRMALTNYLLTSVLAFFLFTGFGLGLFARLSRAELLGVVTGIWVVLLALSHWWLAHYRFGPAEWLWRTLTYGRLQPM